jgi:hypothetical protein
VYYDYKADAGVNDIKPLSIKDSKFLLNGALGPLCRVSGSHAGQGGAIAILGVSEHGVVITNVQFIANAAVAPSKSSYTPSVGGAIAISLLSNLTVQSSLFENNLAVFGVGNDFVSIPGGDSVAEVDNSVSFNMTTFRRASLVEFQLLSDNFSDFSIELCDEQKAKYRRDVKKRSLLNYIHQQMSQMENDYVRRRLMAEGPQRLMNMAAWLSEPFQSSDAMEAETLFSHYDHNVIENEEDRSDEKLLEYSNMLRERICKINSFDNMTVTEHIKAHLDSVRSYATSKKESSTTDARLTSYLHAITAMESFRMKSLNELRSYYSFILDHIHDHHVLNKNQTQVKDCLKRNESYRYKFLDYSVDMNRNVFDQGKFLKSLIFSSTIDNNDDWYTDASSLIQRRRTRSVFHYIIDRFIAQGPSIVIAAGVAYFSQASFSYNYMIFTGELFQLTVQQGVDVTDRHTIRSVDDATVRIKIYDNIQNLVLVLYRAEGFIYTNGVPHICLHGIHMLNATLNFNHNITVDSNSTLLDSIVIGITTEEVINSLHFNSSTHLPVIRFLGRSALASSLIISDVMMLVGTVYTGLGLVRTKASPSKNITGYSCDD